MHWQVITKYWKKYLINWWKVLFGSGFENNFMFLKPKPLTNNSKRKTLFKCGLHQKILVTFISYQNTFSNQSQKTLFKTIIKRISFPNRTITMPWKWWSGTVTMFSFLLLLFFPFFFFLRKSRYSFQNPDVFQMMCLLIPQPWPNLCVSTCYMLKSWNKVLNIQTL